MGVEAADPAGGKRLPQARIQRIRESGVTGLAGGYGVVECQMAAELILNEKSIQRHLDRHARASYRTFVRCATQRGGLAQKAEIRRSTAPTAINRVRTQPPWPKARALRNRSGRTRLVAGPACRPSFQPAIGAATFQSISRSLVHGTGFAKSTA